MICINHTTVVHKGHNLFEYVLKFFLKPLEMKITQKFSSLKRRTFTDKSNYL
jgi:hypothetical protein